MVKLVPSRMTGTLVVFLIFPITPKSQTPLYHGRRLSIMLSLSPRSLLCQISTWSDREQEEMEKAMIPYTQPSQSMNNRNNTKNRGKARDNRQATGLLPLGDG